MVQHERGQLGGLSVLKVVSILVDGQILHAGQDSVELLLAFVGDKTYLYSFAVVVEGHIKPSAASHMQDHCTIVTPIILWKAHCWLFGVEN